MKPIRSLLERNAFCQLSCLKPDETGFIIYVRLLHAVFNFRTFDYVRLFKCSISKRSIDYAGTLLLVHFVQDTTPHLHVAFTNQALMELAYNQFRSQQKEDKGL